MAAVIYKIKEFFKSDKKTKLFVLLGLAGILLIFLSSFFETDNENKNSSVKPAEPDIVSEDTNSYKKQLEKELTDMLRSISGVGDVRVMVTIEGTTEYVYAEEITQDSDTSSEKTSESHENHVVIIENNGNKEALVKKIIKPQVSGVVVVCGGGDNVYVKEQVYSAVSTVLNISTSRICVAKLN